jgi:glycosyltransferase involved in cell wall biosynthesis
MRVLGISTDNVAHFRYRTAFTRYSGLWRELEARYEMVGVIPAFIPTPLRLFTRIWYFRRDPGQRFTAVTFRPRVFAARTKSVDQQLPAVAGKYDVIVQNDTFMAPGSDYRNRRYTIYTDGTYRMNEDYWPRNAPLRGRARERYLKLEGDVYRAAAHLFPMSEFCRRSMIEQYDCDPAKVTAVGAGINLPAVDISGKRYDNRVALFVGYDFERKGGEFVLEAWKRVHARIPDAELRIAGPAKRTDSVIGGVRWLGPLTSREEVARQYSEATVFVLPSLWEAWGLVFSEAMAHGVPCVAANHCAMPEFIDDGVTGRLVKPRDSETLSEALHQILASPELAERMGRQAYATAAEGRSWRDVIDRMAPHLERAAQAGPA